MEQRSPHYTGGRVDWFAAAGVPFATPPCQALCLTQHVLAKDTDNRRKDGDADKWAWLEQGVSRACRLLSLFRLPLRSLLTTSPHGAHASFTHASRCLSCLLCHSNTLLCRAPPGCAAVGRARTSTLRQHAAPRITWRASRASALPPLPRATVYLSTTRSWLQATRGELTW